MRTYIIDKAIVMVIGICAGIWIICLYSPTGALIRIIPIAFVLVVLCRDFLLLPLDYLLGKKTKTLIFVGCIYWKKYIIFRKKRLCRLKFMADNKIIYLTAPDESSIASETTGIKWPEAGQKTIATYYKISKILCGWDLQGKK